MGGVLAVPAGGGVIRDTAKTVSNNRNNGAVRFFKEFPVGVETFALFFIGYIFSGV